MEKFVQQIDLDVAGRNLYKYVYAKQGDSGSRFVKATVLADGKVMKIGSGMTAKFRAEKPDGKAILNPAVVNEDGTVTVELTEQTLAADGVVDADIVISSASGEELSTVSFKIEVEKAPHGSLTDSKNEMLVLQKLIDDSEAALEKLGNVKDGKDGVSPTVSTAATTGGTKVTITDAKGSHEFVVKDGTAGQPGADGSDGSPGIVISSTQPTSDSHPVWIDPNGDASTENPLNLTGATVGQTGKISAVDASGVPTAWEPVDMAGGGGCETWEKIADVALSTDTSLYIVANFATWRKVKIILDRDTFISGLSKNVWCRLFKGKSEYASLGYLTSEYGYLHWEFGAEVNDLFATSFKIASNNRYASTYITSTGTYFLYNVSPDDLDIGIAFTDTSVIQAGDKITVLGVRR